MRAVLAALCLLPLALSQQTAPPGEVPAASATPDTTATNWTACADCHPDANADLPRLSQLRPPSGDTQLEQSCYTCHEPIDFAGLHNDWRHPVLPVGSHIPCSSCHPAAEHGKGAPPPLPTGDYKAEGCFACHRNVELEMNSFFTHGGEPSVTCRGCHPSHEPLAAALPSPLLPAAERDRWQSAYDWYTSNADCLRCHAPAALLLDTRRGFVTVNTVNYHDLHVLRGRVLCIECHNPHGSIRQGMLRSVLLTGEALSYFSRIDGGSCAVACHGVAHENWQYTNHLF